MSTNANTATWEFLVTPDTPYVAAGELRELSDGAYAVVGEGEQIFLVAPRPLSVRRIG